MTMLWRGEPGSPPDADSSSSSSQSSSLSSDSSSSEDKAEMERILGNSSKKRVKHCSHCFLGCSNDLHPVLRLVSQRGGTQGCDCIVL